MNKSGSAIFIVGQKMKLPVYDAAVLRDQLRALISEPFRIVAIEQFEDEHDERGEWISDREACRRTWQGRLERARRIRPDLMSLQAEIEKVLQRLTAVPDYERLHYWEAESAQHTYSGIAGPTAVVHLMKLKKEGQQAS